jgi:hypothetical protein
MSSPRIGSSFVPPSCPRETKPQVVGILIGSPGLTIENVESEDGLNSFELSGSVERAGKLQFRVYPDLCPGEQPGTHDFYVLDLERGDTAQDIAEKIEAFVEASNSQSNAPYDVIVQPGRLAEKANIQFDYLASLE